MLTAISRRILMTAGGFDISAGTGASNSTASFVNRATGEKIAEYANPHIKPESFASVAIALCKYFNKAYMIWDGGGTGRVFGDTVVALAYRNIYYRRNEKTITKKVSDIPGCFLNPAEKKAVIGAYRRALKDRTFIQRSHEANQECLSYIYTMNNSIEHSGSKNSIDPSGAGDNHGDRVIADALAAKALEMLGPADLKKKEQKPKNCFAARSEAARRKKNKKEEW